MEEVEKQKEQKEEEYEWKPRLLNPNVLDRKKVIREINIQTDDKGEGTKNVKLTEEYEPNQKKVKTEDIYVKEIEDYLSEKLYDALGPLYNCVNMIEAESRNKIYYRFDKTLTEKQRKIPLVWNCKSVNEF